MGIANALNNRPVRVLGFVTALHSVVYGTGFLTGVGGFNGALVGLQVSSLALTNILGSVLIIVGVLLAWAYARLNPKTIQFVSQAQAFIWLFVSLMYLLNGAFLLAICVGLVWSIISGYIAYATKNRVNILAYDRTTEARRDTMLEDQL